MEISGKKAVVFGGTSGIGLAAAQRLAGQGAEVTAVSRNPERAGDPGPGITLAACDVRDAPAVQALLAGLAPFDILISAATGGDRALGPFLEMDLDGFKGSFDKLWGYATVVRHGVQHLADDGTIVLVSGSPARRAKPGQAALSAVGAGVEALVRAVAPEIVPRRINVVSPGVIATPMMGPDTPRRAEMLARSTAQYLVPRAGTANEVADAILLLVANDFVTGTTIDIDGGWLLS